MDIAGHKLVGNIGFSHGVRPHCPVFGPKDGLLYVTTELDKTMTIIDPKTLKIWGRFPLASRRATCWPSRLTGCGLHR